MPEVKLVFIAENTRLIWIRATFVSLTVYFSAAAQVIRGRKPATVASRPQRQRRSGGSLAGLGQAIAADSKIDKAAFVHRGVVTVTPEWYGDLVSIKRGESPATWLDIQGARDRKRQSMCGGETR